MRREVSSDQEQREGPVSTLVRDVVVFASAFAFVMTSGALALHWHAVAAVFAAEWRLLALLAAMVVVGLPPRAWRFLYHGLANATVFEAPVPLKSTWVVDGDTIDDRASGVRYRVANIDCPETGQNAKCHNERVCGERAAHAVIRLIRDATTVSVRRTWRKDRYGRRIAFVLVDGADLGDLLVARGLARPWRGSRVKWCGRNGGLARAASDIGEKFRCNACRRWK